ncbi:MAG: bifunctional NADH dehydrogenase FAD-containing subunit/selenide, water dikinase SelD, partial [Pseudomonadota bacterium]
MNGLPPTRDLVLIGGGHTHALVLRRWAMKPLPGTRVTLVNPGPTAPYSGMLPGFVAGHYDRDALDIDLVRLARRAGARLVIGTACGVDRQAHLIEIEGRPPIGYDVASIDVGITSA